MNTPRFTTLDDVFTTGESFSNLTRAFFAAGSQRLLVSQWSIPDSKAVSDFMSIFFRYLSGGHEPNEALRKTKEFIREHHKAPPVHWAGFILVGD